MNTPWHGSKPPDTPITVTLSYRTMKRVLSAIVRDAQRTNSRGNDSAGVLELAKASDVIGNAIDAPAHRRFCLPDQLYHAVIAGTETEYLDWLSVGRPPPNNEPLYIDTVERARGSCYSSYSTIGTWHKRDDAQELVATVKVRTFKQ